MKRIECNHGWSFYESNEGMGFNFGKIEGKPVTLPHDFIITKPRTADAAGGPANGYFGEGQGVYKKTLDVPEEWQGKTVLLDVDGAYMNAEVMLNNELLSLHPYGYTPYLTDLTPALHFDRENHLKIITQSRQPSTRWYSGGGLYRSVALWVGGPVHIRPWDVFVSTIKADEDRAVVRMKIKITNQSGITKRARVTGQLVEMPRENGMTSETVVAEETAIVKLTADGAQTELTLVVVNPKLWDLEHPYLYGWNVQVQESAAGKEKKEAKAADGKLLDEALGECGIRTISISVEKGFCLNGTPLKLKGGCLHHDNGLAGACAYPKAEERKIRILKNVGYNAVRISHYPPSLEMLKTCDRQGMLLLDEAFDAWRLSKVPLDYHLYFEDWWERDMTYMVERDRNHPCVITYSIGNEIGERDCTSNGAIWARKLTEKVRSLDDTRFITSALCGVFADPEEGGSNFDANATTDGMPEGMPDLNSDLWANATEEYVKNLDIVGYNYLHTRYTADHERYPERIMMGTETHSFTTYDYWQDTIAHPYVLGDFIWTAMDYLGEVGVGKVYWEKEKEPFAFMTPYPWRTSWQSDIELTGEQRPQSVFREIMWGNEAKSGLYTTHPKHYGENFFGTNWHWPDVNDSWTFEEEYIGKPVKVDVYGAGDEAEFLLNGRSVGRTPFEKLVATMDVVYEKGTLEAIVYKGKKEISRCKLETAGEAHHLVLRKEDETLVADGRDLAYLHVDIVDENGIRLPAQECKLTCHVEYIGQSEISGQETAQAAAKLPLLVIGSGNPCTEDPIGENWCTSYRGTAVIILKAEKPGEIKVTVEADGLEAVSTTITAIVL